MSAWIKFLQSQEPCPARSEMLKYASAQEAWDGIHRADYLLWLAGLMAGRKCWPDHRHVVRMAVACAIRALKYVQDGNGTPREAVEAAEAWTLNPTDANRQKALEAAEACLDKHPNVPAWEAWACWACACAALSVSDPRRAKGSAAGDATTPEEMKFQAGLVRVRWPMVEEA